MVIAVLQVQSVITIPKKNSEEESTVSCNYWHCDDNGKIVVRKK